MSEDLKLIKCTCPAPAGQVCPVPHDRWLFQLQSSPSRVAAVAAAYPCQCRRSGGCSPEWCACAGRVDVENVPEWCCSRNGNTPRAAAIAKHASAYRTCWCKGDINRHQVEVAIPTVGLIPERPEDDEEED